MTNLIICMTPFQAFIAQRIISLYPNDTFYVVMISYVNNNKFTYYYNQLLKYCADGRFMTIPKYKGKKEFIKLMLSFRNLIYDFPKFDIIFLANLDVFFIHSIIGKHKGEIKTFDDGTANIIPNSFLNKTTLKLKSKILFKFFYKILGINYDLEKLKEKTTEHFTIYNGFENIVPQTTYLPLFPKEDIPEKQNNTQQSIRILLGQPLFIEPHNNEAFFNHILNHLSIDLYFPHPREDCHLNGIKYIQTPLIFEDYLLQEIKKYPQKKFIIYTICSSSALNILNFPNVEIIALKTAKIPKELLPIYDLYKKSNIYIQDI